jgi:hypothetical protein
MLSRLTPDVAQAVAMVEGHVHCEKSISQVRHDESRWYGKPQRAQDYRSKLLVSSGILIWGLPPAGISVGFSSAPGKKQLLLEAVWCLFVMMSLR